MKQTDGSTMQDANMQRAAAFFRQPAWSRLFEAFYEKYIAQGGASGQVTLRDCTAEEQREIARFLKKRLPSHDTLIVRLSDFQRALNESGFSCALADLLTALYPERSHLTRPQQRKLRIQSQQRFYEALSALADTLPSQGEGRHWFLSGAHGRDYLFRRYKNEDPALQDVVLCSAHTVIEALDHLPTPPAYERLSLFAQRISGDPHGLDAQSFAGRLFLRALEDLTTLAHSQGSGQTSPEEDAKNRGESTTASANDPALSEEDTSSSQEHDHQRHLLYYEAGLLTDTISSTISVFQLAYAEDAAEQRDPMLESTKARILILPLRQLLAWKKLAPASEQVYLFENPQVFEDIVDELQRRANSGTDERKVWPTLICTSGWPSVAAIRLLSLLTETDPQIVLHYSGDFDLAGLRIAAYLQNRYPAHCRLWHLDPSSYLAALHHKSMSFDSTDFIALQALPAHFTPLVAAMQEKGRKAYQEGITSLLLKDILAATRRRSVF